MKAILWTERDPDKSCLLLAKALGEVASIELGECLRIAERLYDGQYDVTVPVTIPLRSGVDLSAVRSLCQESEIRFEMFCESV